ncbi:DUF6744 family protein [Streptomyces sp. WZ.A104]|uniref:DUF6744 family protein n=1 Tax=Streptomyces sp. WZ.A104 TaxID=2023771 RepID=UPI001C539492|nr:DUF6744 family protein [Streptomyces sp. WZ.A104]
MTTPPPSVADPELKTGDTAFDAYAEAMSEEGTPLLGHLVLYSIFDGKVTRDDLVRWFTELDLDEALLPPPVRHVDAFERVTGPDGVRVTYPLDDPSATGPASKRGRRRGRNELLKTATLMVRPVRRDGGQIVRHVVREIRDEERTSLEYDTRIAICTFDRDNSENSPEGAGALTIEEDRSAIAKLPEAEQTTVRQMLTDINEAFRHRCTYLTSDKLRSVVRRYVEHLSAIRVRPTGGVYFVHRQHADVLGSLRELVGRFGEGSHLVRVPLPDQEEMREMIIMAFTTKAKDELDELARDIAAAQRAGKADEARKLYERFTALQEATNEHSDLLSTSLDDTRAALQLVKVQLGGLLATATDEG